MRLAFGGWKDTDCAETVALSLQARWIYWKRMVSFFAARSGHIYSKVHKNYCDHLELDSADRESQRSGIWYIMQTRYSHTDVDNGPEVVGILCCLYGSLRDILSLSLPVPEPVDVDVLEDYSKHWLPTFSACGVLRRRLPACDVLRRRLPACIF